MNRSPEMTSQAAAVLVVDDDRHLLRLWAMALQGAGFVVEQADSVAAARAALARSTFDLVVIDLFFAREGGGVAAQGLHLIAELNLKRLENGPLVRTILVSGAQIAQLQVEQVRALGTTFHADAVLTKPFSLDELVDKVRELAPSAMKAS